MARSVLVVVLAAATSACGLTGTQTEAVRRFSAASAGIGELACSELTRMRESAIAMNTLNEALGGKVDPAGLDSAFDPGDVAARVAASESLTAYGRLLGALVDERRNAELDRAAHDFVDRFNALATSRRVAGLEPMDAEQASAIGRAVRAAGGLLVERRKARAVRRVVAQTSGPVQTTIALLNRDFSPDGLNLAQDLETVAARLNNASGAVLDRTTGDYARRRDAAEGKRMAFEARLRMQGVGARTQALLEKLGAAQRELEAALAEPRTASLRELRELGAELTEVSATAEVLRAEPGSAGAGCSLLR